MITVSIMQGDITILNVYVPKIRACNYVRLKLIELQREIDEFIIRTGDFHTPLLEMEVSRRQKISKDVFELNNTIH